MVDTTNRVQGTLTRWDDERGFGFISPSVAGRDVFVHVKAFPRDSERPMLYELLTYEVERAEDGRTQATRVEYVFPKRGTRSSGERDSTSSGVQAFVAIIAFIAIWADVDSYWPVPLWVLALDVGLSIITFVAYRGDKRAAITGRWRTSESSLLALGVLGGWPGALIAQQLLHHKNRKREFQSQFWATVVVNVIAFVVFGSPGFTGFIARFFA
ncbi:MAG: DNA-binding protein [Glaciihabitans sp.]|nr:DNA-binding protein [Glaciihabitans sp.]